MGVIIDVPQIAYKTWSLEYRIYDKNGNRDYIAEHETEQDLKRSLTEYKYSEDHNHVKG